MDTHTLTNAYIIISDNMWTCYRYPESVNILRVLILFLSRVSSQFSHITRVTEHSCKAKDTHNKYSNDLRDFILPKTLFLIEFLDETCYLCIVIMEFAMEYVGGWSISVIFALCYTSLPFIFIHCKERVVRSNSLESRILTPRT